MCYSVVYQCIVPSWNVNPTMTSFTHAFSHRHCFFTASIAYWEAIVAAVQQKARTFPSSAALHASAKLFQVYDHPMLLLQ